MGTYLVAGLVGVMLAGYFAGRALKGFREELVDEAGKYVPDPDVVRGVASAFFAPWLVGWRLGVKTLTGSDGPARPSLDAPPIEGRVVH
ncbi:MAG TPA: hypothetical protein VEA38_11625 [Terriglobales bacterium]|nr:hypothetical protein [Terriglobales bacterium]